MDPCLVNHWKNAWTKFLKLSLLNMLSIIYFYSVGGHVIYVILCHQKNLLLFLLSIKIWKLYVHHVLRKYKMIPAEHNSPVWLIYFSCQCLKKFSKLNFTNKLPLQKKIPFYKLNLKRTSTIVKSFLLFESANICL